jgi:hypothetical protein
LKWREAGHRFEAKPGVIDSLAGEQFLANRSGRTTAKHRRISRDVRVPSAVGVLLGGVEEQEVREVRQLASDDPWVGGRDQFHRDRAACWRCHRARVELKWRTGVHE